MPPTLTIVRHGETEWSRTGRHTGLTDIPLTDAGRAVAKRLERRLAAHAYALVLTSPLSRARDTATLAGFGERAELDGELVEWDYGELEGLTTPEIRETRPGWTIWTGGAPGGETIEEVARRADSVIERVLEGGGDAIAFAHGHVLRVLAARWLRQPPQLGQHLALRAAGVGVLGWERDAPVIERWNEEAQ